MRFDLGRTLVGFAFTADTAPNCQMGAFPYQVANVLKLNTRAT